MSKFTVIQAQLPDNETHILYDLYTKLLVIVITFFQTYESRITAGKILIEVEEHEVSKHVFLLSVQDDHAVFNQWAYLAVFLKASVKQSERIVTDKILCPTALCN